MKKFIASCGYAFNGLLRCYQTQRNFRVHLLVSILAVTAAVILDIANWQWVIICVCIALVLSAELMNTAIEKLCDHVNPGLHPQIRLIKDMAAAAVLLLSVMSVVAGAAILIPAILKYMNS